MTDFDSEYCIGFDYPPGPASLFATAARESDDDKMTGAIEVDSEFGKQIGFTSDKFSWDSYLWRDGERIFISLISSRHEGQGNLSVLFKNIEALGLRVAVPTPFARMQAILEHKGFVMHTEDMGMGACEIWEKPQ